MTKEEQIASAKEKSIEILEKEMADIDANRKSNDFEISNRRGKIKKLEKEIEDLKEQSSRLEGMKGEIRDTIRFLKETPAESPDAKRLTGIIKATIDSLSLEAKD